MQSLHGAKPTATSDDLVFRCEHCGTTLVVEASGAGLAATCASCGKETTVPTRAPVKGEVAGEKLEEMQRHLQENESQRTEVRGYINQLSIQLHRWQLRLQALDDRNKQLRQQIAPLERKPVP